MLTARATDNLGLGVASMPINVMVLYSNLNTVQIEVVDNRASEVGPHEGLCRITRTGSADSLLRVNFALGGTAGFLDYMGLNYIYYSNYVVMLPKIVAVVRFIDAVSPGSPQRFYRAVIMP